MKRINWLLVSIVSLGFILRIVGLGKIPIGFTSDEASQAYTAYSLFKTGHDEWGSSWPTTSFRSFLDYKAPLQTYLMIPSIAIFGLNEFAARLPSAIFGTLAIITVYFLTNKLFPKQKLSIFNYHFSAGVLSALILAISPWHIQFSRTALEVNLSSFLFPAGLLFFLKGLKNPKFFTFTSLFWGLSLYSYHAAKLFTPLFALVTLAIYFKDIKIIHFKKLLLPILVFSLFFTPACYSLFFGTSATRGNDLLITKLNSTEQEEVIDQSSFSPLNKISPSLSRIFSNNASFTVDKFIENYTSYYTPSFWFTEGGREITYSIIPGRGLLYYWQLPFMILGLIYLFKLKDKNKRYLLLSWLFLAALPAALTHEGYRPNRAGSFLCFWEIIIAAGLVYLYQLVPKYKKILTLTIIFIFIFSFSFYLNDYIFLSKVKYPDAMSYGWRDTLSFVSRVENNYQQIKISPKGQSQSFVAFYLKINPQQFQQESGDWWSRIEQTKDITYLDQLGDYKLGKFSFEPLNWPEDINQQTLYISHLPNALLPEKRNTLFTVKTPKRDKILIEVFDFR
jgi:hypothetical protein